jgi:hypothetical protein
MPRNNEDFSSGQTGASDSSPTPAFNPKPGSFHKGRKGYYDDHHSSNTWNNGCNNCKREEKAGKHPLA